MRRGLFGGTFDPVHSAHVELAERARDEYELDEVIFIPAWMTPHKRFDTETASPEHRIKMLQLAIQGCAGLSLSDVEILRKGVSYSVDTVRFFRNLYPEDELFWLMGADCYQSFSSWKDADVILKEVQLLVAHRPGAAPSRPENQNVSWVDMPPLPISSSEIRETIGLGKIPADQIQESVLRYIRKQNLYVTKDNVSS